MAVVSKMCASEQTEMDGCFRVQRERAPALLVWVCGQTRGERRESRRESRRERSRLCRSIRQEIDGGRLGRWVGGEVFMAHRWAKIVCFSFLPPFFPEQATILPRRLLLITAAQLFLFFVPKESTVDHVLDDSTNNIHFGMICCDFRGIIPPTRKEEHRRVSMPAM